MVTRRTASSVRKDKPAGKAGSYPETQSAVAIRLVARRRALRQTACDQPSVRGSDQPAFQISQPHPLYIPSQPKRLQRPDAVPVHIDLIPCNPMLRRGGMRVVIVVPAFPESQQSHPPAIGGKIARSKA